MNQHLSVSVVIPMFNAAQWIQETLTTVVNQTYPVEECVVVDDGSTDGSMDIVERFDWPGSVTTRLLRSENRGPSAARNIGMMASTCELVAFLDADDLWNPRKLELQVGLMNRTNADLCFCSYEMFEAKTGKATGVVTTRNVDQALRRWLAMEGNGFAAGSTLLLRREFLKHTSAFSPELLAGEDFAFIWSAHQAGHATMERAVLVGYRFHGGQHHTNLEETTRSMGKVYDAVFDGGGERALERRCRANLDAHYGYNLLRAGTAIEGARWLWKSFCRDPRRVMSLPLHATGRLLSRWIRARISRRRFFDPIPS